MGGHIFVSVHRFRVQRLGLGRAKKARSPRKKILVLPHNCQIPCSRPVCHACHVRNGHIPRGRHCGQVCGDVEAVGFPVLNVYSMTYGDENTTAELLNLWTHERLHIFKHLSFDIHLKFACPVKSVSYFTGGLWPLSFESILFTYLDPFRVTI